MLFFFMKRGIYIVAIVFCLLANVSNAATGEKIKIATIDMRKIENESYVSHDLEKKMSAKEKEIRQELLREKGSLEQRFKALESKRSIKSAQQLQKDAQQLEIEYQKFQNKANRYEKIFEKTRMDSLIEINKNIKKAINAIANSNSYDLVIALDSVLYINNDKFNDITGKILSKLNKISKTIDYAKIYKAAENEFDKASGKDAKR